MAVKWEADINKKINAENANLIQTNKDKRKENLKSTRKSLSLFFFQPSKADFHAGFDVVFVDPSGYLNLCAGMTGAQYKRVSE